MLIVPNTLLHFRKLSDLSRNTIQFNTLRLPIKKLLASQRNQIYSEASSTHFSAINLSYTYALPIILSLIQINHIYFSTLSDLSRNTIQFNTAIYQSKNFSPLNAIKYILKHLQHTFQLLIYHTLTLYPSYSLLIQINHRHFSTLSDLSRNTIQFNTLRFTNQKTSRLSTQSNIFWSIFNTLFSN